MTQINISLPTKHEIKYNVHFLSSLIVNNNIFFQHFQKYFIILCATTIISIIILMQLQIQKLQSQVNFLMLMYQNNHLEMSNQFQQIKSYNNSINLNSIFPFPNRMENKSDINAVTLTPNQIISNYSIYHENNIIKESTTDILNVTKSQKELWNKNNNELIMWSKMHVRKLQRTKRDNEEQHSEKENKKQQITKENEKIRQQIKRKNKSKKSIKEDRKVRQPRVKNRKRQKSDRNSKNSLQNPLVATFIGAIPEQRITDEASIIGPWIRKEKLNPKLKKKNPYDFTKIHLVKNKMLIKIDVDGLYAISTQISYYGNTDSHSYRIVLNPKGSSEPQNLTTCATVSFNRDVSCHTGIWMYLKRGDRLFLQGEQNNSSINLKPEFSHIQITLYDNSKNNRI